MYLIIDFGLTKLANKIKKKNWDKDLIERGVPRHRRRLSSDKLAPYKRLGYNKAGNPVNRSDSSYLNRANSGLGLPALRRKYNSGEYAPRSKVIKEMIPDNKNFTDIREVEDRALSTTGYMGFKNTPNSFFEESVPMIETGKKRKIKNKQYV